MFNSTEESSTSNNEVSILITIGMTTSQYKDTMKKISVEIVNMCTLAW